MSATFGRLNGSQLDLQPGLNVICAPNESGKSTWCRFLQNMLYGVPTKERGLLADKNRYAPWSGSPMQGRLLLRNGDARYTLLRETRRATAPMGDAHLTYTGTADPVPGIPAAEAGQYLLGIPREVFLRSAFIGQNALAVDQDAELERRIAALISTGEEDTSYSESYERLKKQLNARRANRSTGQIPALEQEIAQLEDALARQESLRKFKEGKLRVLVATDIAARGLDIEELSYVFNYNLSEVPETYIHRIGRTGRAGRGGTAISFCDYGEMPMLKDIEKLLKKPIPRRAHDYPMEVFEVPVKDAKGRVVNPEDAEARQAAREKHAAQRKQAAEKAAEKAAQPLDAPADPAPGRKRRRGKGQGQAAAPQPPAQPPEKGEKARRTFPHGKQNLGNLEDFLAAQPVEEGAVSFSHRDPLEGEVIMDATARLLAAKPVYQYYKPGAAHGKRGKGDKKPKAQAQPAKPQPPEKTPKAAQAAQTRKAPKKGAPAPAKKGTGALGRPAARSGRGRGRIPPRVEPPKSRQKDSTEQKSLMKPFYIDHD